MNHTTASAGGGWCNYHWTDSCSSLTMHDDQWVILTWAASNYVMSWFFSRFLSIITIVILWWSNDIIIFSATKYHCYITVKCCWSLFTKNNRLRRLTVFYSEEIRMFRMIYTQISTWHWGVHTHLMSVHTSSSRWTMIPCKNYIHW